MCRSIKQLRRPPTQPATQAEISAAALQYIRKVSGFRAPSKANQAAFDAAVAEVARATQALLTTLPPARPAPEPTAADAHAHPAEHAHPHPHPRAA